MLPKTKIEETDVDYKVSFEGTLLKSNPFSKFIVEFIRSMDYDKTASPIDPDLESRL